MRAGHAPRRDGGEVAARRERLPFLRCDVRRRCARCQRPMRNVRTMPATATSAHQTMLLWPYGATRNAASSGPIADPALPPT